MIVIPGNRITMNMQWIYDDAIFLKENGRLKGCLCLLLCLVDALAAKHSPEKTNNKERYCCYLKKKLVEAGLNESYRIEEQGRLVHLSEIIYKYFRCFLVHEADTRDDEMYEVQLEYDESGRFVFDAGILVDRSRKQFIVKAEWLVSILFMAVEAGMEA